MNLDVAMNRAVRTAVTVVAVSLAYFLAARLGLSLAFVNESASAVWPATGVAIAAGILLGAPAFLGIFIGAFLANLATNGILVSSGFIAIGNSLEAIIATILVTRFAGGGRAFESATNVFRYILFAGVVATAVSATIGVTTLVLSGLAPPAAAQAIWTTWWLGDLAGGIVVAPVIITWARAPRVAWSAGKWLEAMILLATTLTLSAIVFGGLGSILPRNAPGSFALLPVIVWAAYRFSRRETATITMIIGLIAVVGTLRGEGPFARGSPNEALLFVQSFLFVVTIIALPLAAVVHKLKAGEIALAASRDALEERVVERTRELAESERKFAGFSENIPALAWIKDAEGRYLFSNQAFADSIGKSRSSVLGRTDQELFPDDIASEYHENDSTVLKTGEVLNTTERQNVKGEMRISLVNKFLIPGARPGEKNVAGIAIDITERALAERRLAEAQRLGRVGSFEWETQTNRVTWSDETERILGVEGRAGSTTFADFVARFDESSRERVALALTQSAQTKTTFQFTESVQLASGATRWVEVTGGTSADSGSRAGGVAGTLQDVTQRWEAEAEGRRTLVTRKLVRRLLRELTGTSGTIAARRDLGRNLGADAPEGDIEHSLDVFQSMGIGRVALQKAVNGRYIFEGTDLLEVTPGYAGQTCFIALGYLESLVARAEGAAALGAETACQSQGHEHCVFDVRLRR